MEQSSNERRRRLLEFLESSEPAWKDEDHPELEDGAAAWVERLRAEDERAWRAKLDDRMIHD